MKKNDSSGSPIKHLPFGFRLCFQLLLVVIIGFIIKECRNILVPLYFSVLLSIILLPLSNFFEKIRLSRALGALLSVLFALLVIGVLVYLLSSQVFAFLNDIPSIKLHLAEHYESLQHWIEQRFNITVSQQSLFVNHAKGDMNDSGIGYLRDTLFSVSQIATFIIFSMVCSFLFLYYRHTIKIFLYSSFSSNNKQDVSEVISGSKGVIKNYMMGLIIEMIIVSTCNVGVLMLIGIKYAVFLGVFTALLNIIPFIGIYSGTIFTALVTLTTSASLSQIIWIFIGLLSVHFVDTNFLMPRIVGSRVKVNALMTILGALIGGFLIGIPGIFLALPTIAILKIVFDNIEEMKPWGVLLGVESPPLNKKSSESIRKNKKNVFTE